MQEIIDVKDGVLMMIKEQIDKKTSRSWFVTLSFLVLSLVALNYSYTDKAVEASKQVMTAQNKEQDATTNAIKELLKSQEVRISALEEGKKDTDFKLDRNFALLEKIAGGKK